MRYFRVASSVCSLPSLVVARARKISKISIVRSSTSTCKAALRLRIWLPVSSPSKMAASASVFRHTRRASSTLPSPRRVAASGVLRFWHTVATACMPLASARAASSSRLRWESNLPWSSASSTTRTGGHSLSRAFCPTGASSAGAWVAVKSRVMGSFISSIGVLSGRIRPGQQKYGAGE